LNSESGGFLLKDVETIKRIIDRVIKVSNVPVSVKLGVALKKEIIVLKKLVRYVKSLVFHI